MTFWEPEVELDPKEGGENYHPQPSIIDVETWLDWQAHQLDMPCWWMELTAIPWVEDPWKLARKIHTSFSIPESEAGSSQGKIIPHSLPLSASPGMCSSQMNYLIRMCNNNLFSYCCLCLRVAVLGGETQSTREPRFLPLGKKCHRVEREGERACHVYQMGHHPGLRESQSGGY